MLLWRVVVTVDWHAVSQGVVRKAHMERKGAARTGRGQDGSLVAVDGVVVEEALDLEGDVGGLILWAVVVEALDAIAAPFVDEALEHAVGAELVDLAQAAKRGELVVGLVILSSATHGFFLVSLEGGIGTYQTHVGLVGLHVCLCDGLKFRGGNGG